MSVVEAKPEYEISEETMKQLIIWYEASKEYRRYLHFEDFSEFVLYYTRKGIHDR